MGWLLLIVEKLFSSPPSASFQRQIQKIFSFSRLQPKNVFLKNVGKKVFYKPRKRFIKILLPIALRNFFCIVIKIHWVFFEFQRVLSKLFFSLGIWQETTTNTSWKFMNHRWSRRWWKKYPPKQSSLFQSSVWVVHVEYMRGFLRNHKNWVYVF